MPPSRWGGSRERCTGGTPRLCVIPTQSMLCFFPLSTVEKNRKSATEQRAQHPFSTNCPSSVSQGMGPHACHQPACHPEAHCFTLLSTQHRSWGQLGVFFSGLLSSQGSWSLIWVQLGLHSAFPILLHLKITENVGSSYQHHKGEKEKRTAQSSPITSSWDL